MCWTDILYDQMAPDWRGLSGGCRQEMGRASDCCGCGDGGRSCREEKRFGGKGGKSWSLTENRTAVGAMTRVGDERGQV